MSSFKFALRKPAAGKAARMFLALALVLTMVPSLALSSPVPAYADETERPGSSTMVADHLASEADASLAGEQGQPSALDRLRALFTGADASSLTDTGHTLYLRHSYADAAYLEDGETIDSLFSDPDTAGLKLITTFESQAALYELSPDADYWIAFVSPSLFNGTGRGITDWIAAEANDKGVLVDGVEVDAEAGIAYVPKSLYFDEGGAERAYGVQLQLLVPVRFEQDSTSEVHVFIDNDRSKATAVARKLTVDAATFDITTTIPVTTAETAGAISLSDLTVYVNDSESAYTLNDETAFWDSATGELTIAESPATLSTVSVVIDSGLLPADKAHAAGLSASDLKKIPKSLGPYLTSGEDAFEVGDVFWYTTTSTFYSSIRDEDMIPVYEWSVPYLYCWRTDVETKNAYNDITSSGYADWDDMGGVVSAANSGSDQYINFAQSWPTGVVKNQDGEAFDFTSMHSGSWKYDYYIMQCTHVSVADGLDDGKEWIGDTPRPAVARVLAVGSDYVVMGFVSAKLTTQSGIAIYKIHLDSKGELDLVKASADASVTGGSDCYSLEGAEYGVYRSSSDAAGDKNRVATFVTDESGNADAVQLPVGTYYVREVKASKGYALDTQTYTVAVKGGSTAYVNGGKVYERPLNDPAGVLLRKVDAETGESVATGGASLALAEYTFEYFDGYYGDGEDGYTDISKAGAPTRSWVLRTDEDGYTSIGDAGRTFSYNGKTYPYLVSGDALYKTSAGYVIVPLGTVRVTETKAPQGYNLDSKGSFVFRIMADEDGNVYREGESLIIDSNTGNASTKAEEQVKRGDIRFEKKSEATANRMAYVPFRITSEDTGESHVIVTDANGEFASTAKKNPHTQRTNANDSASAGSFDETAGLWFGEGEPNDALGALPYGTYTIEELPCAANEGLQLVKETGVTVSRHSYEVDLGTIDDPEANISTSIRDDVDGDRNVSLAPSVTVIDRVTYSGLIAGEEYVVEGALMDKATGKALEVDGEAVTSSATFTARKSSGYVELTFSFDASGLAGRDLVAFETVYADGRVVATHQDIDDFEQTVTVLAPSIGTTASDAADGNGTVMAAPGAAIEDEVSYTGLIPGGDYVLKATLMDRTTGEAVEIDGSPVTASWLFTPSASTGTETVTLELDATGLAGRSLVVFEELYLDGALVAEHKDIDDPAQTVEASSPSISTIAFDRFDEDKSLVSGLGVEIADVVSYDGLVAGEEYVLQGSLYNPVTKAPVANGGKPVTASTTFTAKDTYGTAEVTFRLDTAGLEGKSIVVVERLYKDGALIAEHADLADEAQTVEVVAPVLSTSAADAVDGDKMLLNGTESRIIDTVSYSGVQTGHEYQLRAVVMDAGTGEALYVGGERVEAGASFTALDTYGTATVEIPLDASGLAGRTLVVFETLLEDGHVLAVHHDLLDERQTVEIVPPHIATSAADAVDGDGVIVADAEATIVDTVSYEGLTAGLEYELVGTLMVRETGEALLVGGQPVTASATFKALDTYGTAEVTFTFDAFGLEGQSLVVFEELYRDGAKLMEHADIADEAQTVTVVAPEISTFASSAQGGGKSVPADSASGIVDEVSYENLIPGEGYTLYGIVVDRATGLPLLTGSAADAAAEDYLEGLCAALGVELADDGTWTQTGSASAQAVSDLIASSPAVASKALFATQAFTPVLPSGTVEVSFDFDASGLAGERGVVYQFLVRNDTSRTVAVHADVLSGAQTFSVTSAYITTTAVDGADSDKQLAPEPGRKIRDAVTYHGLVPGTQYRLTGTLMDKETGKALVVGGAQVTSELYFTPNHSDGTVYVDFTLDASSLEGRSVVVFETVEKDGKVVAEHADINDEAQTVKVKKPTIGSFFAKMGVSASPFATLYGACGLGIAACMAYALVQLHLDRREREGLGSPGRREAGR